MRRTLEATRTGPTPAVSLRPAPRCEPPFDDELEPTVWATAHQLALEWSSVHPKSSRSMAPEGPINENAPPGSEVSGTWQESEAPGSGLFDSSQARSGQAGSRVAGSGQAGSGGAGSGGAGSGGDGSGGARSGVPRAALPYGSPIAGASTDAKLAVRRFVRTCVEVLNGHRPAAHLRRLSRPIEASEVAAQGMAAAHRVAELRKAARAPGRRPVTRPSPVAVLHVRLCEPRPGAVEAAVALLTGERTWAMALRLELHQESWCATTLRLI